MYRRSLLLGFVVALAVLASASALLPHQSRVLVLLDSLSQQHSHSKFFNALRNRGYDLIIQTADDPSLALVEYGNYMYDNLIIFSSNIEELGGLVDAAAIIEFVDSGRNVLIATDKRLPGPIRDIAKQCGVMFDSEKRLAVDHLFHDVADDDHGRLILDVAADLVPVLGPEKLGPIIYRGVSHNIKPDSVDAALAFPVLKGRRTLYPAPHAGLVSALQARNNARVVFSGSVALFSDRYFNARVASNDGSVKADKSGNEKFSTELSKWVFHERGVLRLRDLKHHKKGETEAPAVYRILDNVTFSVVIEEWNGAKWAPYQADDVQVEFTMLDPYLRRNLKVDANGVFSLDFVVPDVYGIFKFHLDYHRFGYTSLFAETQAPVRPFRHNEYERFISSAFPYYASAFSMLAGIFLFSVVFLFHKDKKQ